MNSVELCYKELRREVMLAVAWLWRRLMFRTTFIAITGSVGKTSCKEAIAEILSTRYPTLRTRGGNNHFRGVFRTILLVRPWHRYCVIEIGLDRPGQMEKFARAVKPDIAVWVSVARTHTMMFKTLENTAREKSLLVSALRPGGIAVLNDENPYISPFKPPEGVTTIYFGSTDRSSCKASNASSRWPEKLNFRAEVDGEVAEMKTQFLGVHWVNSILPALAIGKLAGVPLASAAEALSRYEPLSMRMAPVRLPNGATMIRDERNGSVDTMEAALKVFGDATAARKLLVLTDVSDSTQKPRQRLVRMGRRAAEVADAVMFVGEHCEHGVRGAIEAGMRPDQVWPFYNMQDAAEHLRRELREDDLVLLRGRRVDHMQRLYLNLVRDVRCWKNSCSKPIHCEVCWELAHPRRRRVWQESRRARLADKLAGVAELRYRFKPIGKGDRY
jgi:UDP-N-acetylmuramoyl-tripeptide--D-alanyl-D-alanine ligase